MSRLSLDDTIAAIATPPGEGALGIVRLSGPDTFAIADRLFRPSRPMRPSQANTHTVHHGHIVDGDVVVDEVLMTVLRAPRTYTRQDMIEITGHGGMLPLRRIVELALHAGARLAEPGEFTKRAFLNGRIDLAQGEAVLDVIRARTEVSLRAALQQLGGHLSQRISTLHEELANLVAHVEATIDFPEEDIASVATAQCRERLQRLVAELARLESSAKTGRILREGAAVVLCGRPNVGKSSLLNALLRTNRAIVTPIPGTTRDTIEELLNLRGLPVRLVDTAGVTVTEDPIEREGVERSRHAIQQADLLLLILDSAQPLSSADRAFFSDVRALRNGATSEPLIVINKNDLPTRLERDAIAREWSGAPLRISALRGEGLTELEDAMAERLWSGTVDIADGALVTNVRHQESLRQARVACAAALAAITRQETLECIALDLREASEHLGEILGINVQEDLLERIFKQFCIGK